MMLDEIKIGEIWEFKFEWGLIYPPAHTITKIVIDSIFHKIVDDLVVPYVKFVSLGGHTETWPVTTMLYYFKKIS